MNPRNDVQSHGHACNVLGRRAVASGLSIKEALDMGKIKKRIREMQPHTGHTQGKVTDPGALDYTSWP